MGWLQFLVSFLMKKLESKFWRRCTQNVWLKRRLYTVHHHCASSSELCTVFPCHAVKRYSIFENFEKKIQYFCGFLFYFAHLLLTNIKYYVKRNVFQEAHLFLVWLFRLHLANKRECTITEMVMQLEIIPSHKAVLSGSVIRLRSNRGPVCVIPGRSISPRPFSLHKSYSKGQ
jgi:hypothetical protein